MLKMLKDKNQFDREYIDTTDEREVRIYNIHQKGLMDYHNERMLRGEFGLVKNYDGYESAPEPERFLEVETQEDLERRKAVELLMEKIDKYGNKTAV